MLMKKLNVILVLFGWLVLFACNQIDQTDKENSVAETAINATGQVTLQDTLAEIFRTVNTNSFRLDSARIDTQETTNAKMLQLYGTRTDGTRSETIATYIRIKLYQNSQYLPDTTGMNKAKAISCSGLQCKPCELVNKWQNDAYCACTDKPTQQANDECNMNSDYSGKTLHWFSISKLKAGLIYKAGS